MNLGLFFIASVRIPFPICMNKGDLLSCIAVEIKDVKGDSKMLQDSAEKVFGLLPQTFPMHARAWHLLPSFPVLTSGKKQRRACFTHLVNTLCLDPSLQTRTKQSNGPVRIKCVL